MKKIFALIFTLIVFVSGAMAQEADIVRLELDRRESFVYPKKVLTAYYIGREFGSISIAADGTLTIFPRGNTRIQVINLDGSVTTLVLSVSDRTQNNKVKSGKNGYLFRYRYFNEDRDYVSPDVRDVNFWNHSFLLTTRVGQDDRFTARYSIQANRNDSYYYQYDLDDKWMAAYGDSAFVFNNFRVSRLGLPTMRQTILGFDNREFEFKIWQGQKASYYLSPQSDPNEESLYGAKMEYSISPSFDVFFSNATNNEKDIQLNYLGFRKNLFKNHTIMGTFGGSDDRKGGAWRYTYQGTTESWGLNRVEILHELMAEGTDSPYGISTTPYERFQGRADFFNPKAGPNGTFFVSPGFRYILDGYDISKEGSGAFGWRTKRLRIFNDYRYVLRENEVNQNQSEVQSLRPGITFYLLDNVDERFSLTLSQSQQTTTNKPSNIEYQSSRTEISTDYRKGVFFTSARVGRSTTDSVSGNEIAGYFFGGRVGAKYNKFSVFAGSDWQYLDSQYVDPTETNYELARNVLSAGASARVGSNHLLSLSGQRVRNTLRDLDSVRFIYTFEMGSQTRSLTEAIMPASVSAEIFDDKNFNGVKDPGESVVDNIKFFLTSGKDVQERTGGKVEFSKLERKPYNLSFENDKWISEKTNFVLDLNQSYSSSSFSIPAYPRRTVVVRIKTTEQLSFASKIDCGGKLFMMSINPGNNVLEIPAKSKCVMTLDSPLAQGTFSFSDNDFELEDDNSIEFFKEKMFSGYIVKDKNKNQFNDEGEGFATEIDFGSGVVVKSDKSGYFAFDVDNVDAPMTFKRKGCSLKPNVRYFNELIRQKRSILIICQ